MKGRTTLVLLMLLALAGQGCATTGDVEALENRVTQLETQRERLRAKMEEDVNRLEKLHKMLTEAEETLRKSGANLGIRVEKLEQSVSKQGGQLEVAEHRLKKSEGVLEVVKRELADRLGSTAIYLPPDLPKDKDGIWKAGKDKAAANDVRTAKAIFALYEANFPDDVRAPHALWEAAKLLEKSGDLEGAIRFLQKIHDRHESSTIAPQAVMRIAEIYVLQNDCQRAKGIYQFVASTYKGLAEAIEARQRSRKVLKECK